MQEPIHKSSLLPLQWNSEKQLRHQLGSLPKDVQESDFSDFVQNAREQRKKLISVSQKLLAARKAGTNQKLITKLTERQKNAKKSYLKFFQVDFGCHRSFN